VYVGGRFRDRIEVFCYETRAAANEFNSAWGTNFLKPFLRHLQGVNGVLRDTEDGKHLQPTEEVSLQEPVQERGDLGLVFRSRVNEVLVPRPAGISQSVIDVLLGEEPA